MARGSRAGAGAGAGAALVCEYPDRTKVAAHNKRNVGDARIGMVAGAVPLIAERCRMPWLSGGGQGRALDRAC